MSTESESSRDATEGERRSGRGCLFLTLTVAAAIAGAAVLVVPNFVRFGARSKQSEAKSVLRDAYIAAKAVFQERDAYTSDAFVLGVTPPSGNRYAVFLAPAGLAWERGRGAEPDRTKPGPVVITEDRSKYPPPHVPLRFADTGCPLTPITGHPKLGKAGLGIKGAPPDQAFVFAVVGNIDTDPDWDCWSVASHDRRDEDGDLVPAGAPFNERDDTE